MESRFWLALRRPLNRKKASLAVEVFLRHHDYPVCFLELLQGAESMRENNPPGSFLVGPQQNIGFRLGRGSAHDVRQTRAWLTGLSKKELGGGGKI